jgi:biopolymer transport protein ExbD
MALAFRRSREPLFLNMTPMIDVVFQLLIFFVCTVEFQRAEQQLAAALPPPGPGTARTLNELDLGRIDITASPAEIRIRFQGRTITIPQPDADAALVQLRDQLQTWSRIDTAIPVRVRCDGEVPTGVLLRVYDACLQSGFKDVGIVQE